MSGVTATKEDEEAAQGLASPTGQVGPVRRCPRNSQAGFQATAKEMEDTMEESRSCTRPLNSKCRACRGHYLVHRCAPHPSAI